MTEKATPDSHATLGSLLRRPYETMSDWLYAEMAKQGFPVRPSFSAVLRNLPPSGASVSELAARANMTKQSMAYLVEQMVAAGLVSIAPHPHDRRANTVRLTERGEQAVAAAVELSQVYETRLAELIGKDKVARLRSILAELYDKLDEAAPDV